LWAILLEKRHKETYAVYTIIILKDKEEQTMITIRKASERGSADHGWLRTSHTFSFADYYDPQFMGFSSLRVINDDHVAEGEGFPRHPHNNMEIVTYVLSGSLEHKDSMGNGSVIYPGEVQRMSAGTGVTHSEYNHSKVEELHFLQIWILPNQQGVTPGYEQKFFSDEQKRGKFCLVASEHGEEDSVSLHQDTNIYAALLDGDEQITFEIPTSRKAWVHVAQGSVEMNGYSLHEGDGAAIDSAETLKFSQGSNAEILLFSLT
jgi:redox-sensitive bicupin YhaK (pirin superfamily)